MRPRLCKLSLYGQTNLGQPFLGTRPRCQLRSAPRRVFAFAFGHFPKLSQPAAHAPSAPGEYCCEAQSAGTSERFGSRWVQCALSGLRFCLDTGACLKFHAYKSRGLFSFLMTEKSEPLLLGSWCLWSLRLWPLGSGALGTANDKAGFRLYAKAQYDSI